MRWELRRLFRLSSLRNEEDVPMAERKQEHTTHLLGAAVVVKTHPRIELRGRLDSLNAAIIRVQIQARGRMAICWPPNLSRLRSFSHRWTRSVRASRIL